MCVPWDAVSASLVFAFSCFRSCLPPWLGCRVRLPGFVFLLSPSLSPMLAGMPCPCSGLVSKMSYVICATVWGLRWCNFVDTPPIRDHSSNGLVEGIRQLAPVLQCRVEDQVGTEIPVSHPLMSWSFVHASWLLNRFQVKGGMTPFEIRSGRQYTGKVAEFGGPVLAYTYVSPGPKGGAHWQNRMFCGQK